MPLETFSLRDPLSKEREQQDRDNADHVQRAPSVREVFDLRKDPHRSAVSRAAKGAEHSNSPTAMWSGKFFGNEYKRDRRTGHKESAGYHLTRHELSWCLCKGGEGGCDGGPNQRNQKHATATDAIGIRDQCQRRNRTEANHAEVETEVDLGHRQSLCDLRQGRGQHRKVVLFEHQRERYPEEQGVVLFFERRDGPKNRKQPLRSLCDHGCSGGVGVWGGTHNPRL